MTYRLLSYQSEGGPRGGLSIDGKIYDLERETGFVSVLAALQSQKPVTPKGRSEPVKNARIVAPVSTRRGRRSPRNVAQNRSPMRAAQASAAGSPVWSDHNSNPSMM